MRLLHCTVEIFLHSTDDHLVNIYDGRYPHTPHNLISLQRLGTGNGPGNNTIALWHCIGVVLCHTLATLKVYAWTTCSSSDHSLHGSIIHDDFVSFHVQQQYKVTQSTVHMHMLCVLIKYSGSFKI